MKHLVLLLLASCSEDLMSGVTPYQELDYKTSTSWKRTLVSGDAPGHEGYRTIYANDIATGPFDRFGYAEGAILIKEVFNDAARTELRHVAVMRRIGAVERALEDDGGWYFTEGFGDEPEKHFDFCFRRCHVAAPYNGAWFDYRD